MPTESDLPQTTAADVRMDGVGCLAISGMILCGTIFLAPLGVVVIAVSLVLFIIGFVRDWARTRAAGPCPACFAALIWAQPGDVCRCHHCEAPLRIEARRFRADLPEDG